MMAKAASQIQWFSRQETEKLKKTAKRVRSLDHVRPVKKRVTGDCRCCDYFVSFQCSMNLFDQTILHITSTISNEYCVGKHPPTHPPKLSYCNFSSRSADRSHQTNTPKHDPRPQVFAQFGVTVFRVVLVRIPLRLALSVMGIKLEEKHADLRRLGLRWGAQVGLFFCFAFRNAAWTSLLSLFACSFKTSGRFLSEICGQQRLNNSVWFFR